MPDWPQFAWFMLISAAILGLPGLAFLAWLPCRTTPTWPPRDLIALLADALALSFALQVLLALVLHLAGARFSPAAVVSLYVFCLLALLGAAVWRRLRLPSLQRGLALAAWGIAAALLVIALAGWRLYQARELALPAWVDPVHHTLIVRVILDQGGIAPDFLPYIPAPFYYHFGFHLMAALFAMLSQLPAQDAVLWFGQVLNAMVALSVYRLAYAFLAESAPPPEGWVGGVRARPAAAALIAALLVTFSFQMPAYYLTWGRYTLLSGLLLLGPALSAAWEAWQAPRRTDAWLRMAVLLAAMALTHYYVVVFAGLFILPLFVWGGLKALRGQPERAFLLRLVLWSLLAVLLVLPWLWRVIAANPQAFEVRVVTPFEQSESSWNSMIDYFNYILYLVGPRRNHILMAMAGLGLLAAWLRPQLRLLAVWSALMALLALPWGIRFYQIRPDYFAIVLFFPAAILLSHLLVTASEAAGQLVRAGGIWRASVSYAALALVVGLLLAWGLRDTRSILNPVTVFTSQADRAALDWVDRNTPPDARFFINTTNWMQGLDRGVDGGYWLTPYTGRSTVLPPVLYVWADAEYVQQVRDHTERSRQIQGCDPSFWSLVRDAGLTHIYLREGAGSLQPAALLDCPRLSLRYSQDSVFIYEINRP